MPSSISRSASILINRPSPGNCLESPGFTTSDGRMGCAGKVAIELGADSSQIEAQPTGGGQTVDEGTPFADSGERDYTQRDT